MPHIFCKLWFAEEQFCGVIKIVAFADGITNADIDATIEMRYRNLVPAPRSQCCIQQARSRLDELKDIGKDFHWY